MKKATRVLVSTVQAQELHPTMDKALVYVQKLAAQIAVKSAETFRGFRPIQKRNTLTIDEAIVGMKETLVGVEIKT